MAHPRTVAENIQAIVDIEENEDRDRNVSDRVADAIGSFAGRVVFVVLHLAWFGLWAATNTGWIDLTRPFDPYPFQLLAMLVSLEGVLLSTFVLIRQNRMFQRAERRAHLDLQVNLLTEIEVSKVIQMLQRISERLDIPVDAEADELSQRTAVADLARQVGEKLPEEV